MNNLALYTGVDITFKSKYKIHQPTMTELSEFDEPELLKIINLLCVNKQGDVSSLVVFLSLLFGDILSAEDKINVIKMLELIFQKHLILFSKETGELLLKQDGQDQEPLIFTEENFNDFQEVIRGIFAYDKLFAGDKKNDYNPANAKAEEIANKLKARQAKLAKMKSKENEDKSLFGNYLSIVSTALGENLTDLSQKVTLFQLLRHVERIGMREGFNQLLRIKTSFVTASSSKEPLEDWMRII